MSTVEPVSLYPTPVWVTDLEDFEQHNRKMLDYLVKLQAEGDGLSRSNVLGWHSPDNLHRERIFQPLCREIDRLLNEDVAGALQLDIEHHHVYIKTMWGLINQKYAYNFVHRHGGFIFSGVYYLQCSASSGNLKFHDPRADVRMLRPPLIQENIYTFHVVEYEPRPGRLILFPAWLPHEVGPNLSEQERIAVSFDISFEPRT